MCIGGGGDYVEPSCGQYQCLHSDWGHSPGWNLPTPPMISVNFTIEALNRRNGATRFLLGTHRGHPHVALANEKAGSLVRMLAPVPAGCAILRDVRCIHGGTPNSSPKPRYLPAVEYQPLDLEDDMYFYETPLPQRMFDQLNEASQHLASRLVDPNLEMDVDLKCSPD